MTRQVVEALVGQSIMIGELVLRVELIDERGIVVEVSGPGYACECGHAVNNIPEVPCPYCGCRYGWLPLGSGRQLVLSMEVG